MNVYDHTLSGLLTAVRHYIQTLLLTILYLFNYVHIYMLQMNNGEPGSR